MEYKVDKDIPIPPARSTLARYPFADMEPGDTFAVPAEENKKVRLAAHSYGKRHGKAFTIRRQEDGTVRVWRTA